VRLQSVKSRGHAHPDIKTARVYRFYFNLKIAALDTAGVAGIAGHTGQLLRHLSHVLFYFFRPAATGHAG